MCDIVTFPHWEAGETRGENLCDTGTVRESIISSRYCDTTKAKGKREKSVCDIVTFPHWEAGETRGEILCDTGTVRESIISSRYNRSFKQI